MLYITQTIIILNKLIKQIWSKDDGRTSVRCEFWRELSFLVVAASWRLGPHGPAPPSFWRCRCCDQVPTKSPPDSGTCMERIIA